MTTGSTSNVYMDLVPKTRKLAELVEVQCPHDGSHGTEVRGLFLTRYSTPAIPRTSLQNAVLCVVAQGSKSIFLHERRLVYDPSNYLLVSLDLPLVGQLEEASLRKPFLGLSLVLDFEEIACLAREMKLPPESRSQRQPELMVAAMNEELMDAVLRLIRLLSRPEQIRVLAPLIRREIFYQLLLSEQGGLLRRMVATSGNVQRVALGLAWIKKNVTRPIRMEELAREMRMSASAMYQCFRLVTSMSPLQYQKQLRLQEARRLMIAEFLDAGTAGLRVGYVSSSQFSREYRRLFGAPPSQDVERLRAGWA